MGSSCSVIMTFKLVELSVNQINTTPQFFSLIHEALYNNRKSQDDLYFKTFTRKVLFQSESIFKQTLGSGIFLYLFLIKKRRRKLTLASYLKVLIPSTSIKKY